MAAEHPKRVSYRFGPLEQRGLIAGWRSGQVIAVAFALTSCVFFLRVGPTGWGIVAAVMCVLIGVAVACVPVRGRTPEQWAPVVLSWVWESTIDGRRWTSSSPWSGIAFGILHAEGSVGPSTEQPFSVAHPTSRLVPALMPTSWRGLRPRIGRAAGVFDHLSLEAVSPESSSETAGQGEGRVGVVMDRRSRTATVALAVQGHSFELLSPHDQDTSVASWARILASLAQEGSVVHRIQWVETCLPDDGRSVRSDRLHRSVLPPESEAARSYDAVIEETTPISRSHQVLVGISVHAGHAARQIRGAGGGLTGAARVLLREAHALRRLLEQSGLSVEGILGPAALAAAIRAPLRPAGTTLREREKFPDYDSAERPCSEPWPMAMDTRWDVVRVDATWHATYWIAEWPRVEVMPDFLGPLLFLPVRRSLGVTMEPISPSRAARQVAQARTADVADAELRRRGGFLATARQARERRALDERDAELAEGHAQYRFTGFVTVTADTLEALHQAAALVEQAAGQCRIELRLLYGQQDAAFACTLPLARGLS